LYYIQFKSLTLRGLGVYLVVIEVFLDQTILGTFYHIMYFSLKV